MKVLITNRQRYLSLNRDRILKAAGDILSCLNLQSAELSILLVGDRKMKELNRIYRGKDGTTDVLSFEAGIPVSAGESGMILGDIVINVARADEQARARDVGIYEEINRLLVHGTLHLTGYDHEVSPKEAQRMSRKERKILDALEKMAT
jgi:probable rRNA maturation factor